MSLLLRLEQDHREVLERFSLLTVTLQKTEREDVKLLEESEDVGAIFDLLENKIPNHFASEEKILFPWLEKIVPNTKGFISELLSEHEKIRKDSAELLRDRSSPQASPERLANLLKRITESLSAHARKEDEKLLPLVRRFGDEAKLRELDRLFSEMSHT